VNLAALAGRNLLRQKRRTAITLSALVIGLAGMTVFQGYLSETMRGFRDATIRDGIGHLQIAASDRYYLEGEFNPYSFLLTGAAGMVSDLGREPHVRAVFPSTGFTAIASTGAKSTTLLVKGFPVSDMTFGGAGDSSASAAFHLGRLDSGANLAKDGSSGLILGKTAARILGVQIGQTITLMAILPDGGLNGQDFLVAGIYDSPGKDKLFAYTDYQTAMAFIHLDQPPVLHVILDSPDYAGTLASRLSGHAVKPWQQLASYYVQVNDMFQGFLAVIQGILLLITLFILANTMNRIVFERMKEWGTLRAMGTKQSVLLGLIVTEGGLLGLAGSILGLGFGFLLAAGFNLFGGLPFRNGGTTLLIPIHPDWAAAVGSIVPVVVTAALATAFPAVRVIRLTPADCLRQA
jgi:putative ABC transport system permease protein